MILFSYISDRLTPESQFISMKRRLLLTALILAVILPLSGQHYNGLTDISLKRTPGSGFVNIIEVSGSSFGLSRTGSPNEEYFCGVTDILGYQIEKHFFVGAGFGFMAYDSSHLYPLFIDMRYTTCFKSINPYLFYDSGVLIDFENVSYGSQMFINPGAGLSWLFSPRIEGTFGAGLMLQMQPEHRTSFINLKLALIFRKRSRSV
jgi:hypothetical protein